MYRKKTGSLFTRINQSNFVAQVAFFLLLTMLAPVQVFAEPADYSLRTEREPLNPQYFAEPSNVPNGSFQYSAPVVIPPGRNGIQPDIKLRYSSSPDREGSIFGYGWSLNIPYIERINKLGSDRLYNQDQDHTFFYSSLSGELLPIVSTTTSNYFLSSFFSKSLFSPRKLALADTAEGISTDTPSLPEATTTTLEEQVAPLDGLITATDTVAMTSLATTTPPVTVQTTSTDIPVVSSDASFDLSLFPELATPVMPATENTTSEPIDLFQPDGKPATGNSMVEIEHDRTPTSQKFFAGIDAEGNEQYVHRFFERPQFALDKTTGRYALRNTHIEENPNAFTVSPDAPYNLSLSRKSGKPVAAFSYNGFALALDLTAASTTAYESASKESQGAFKERRVRYPDFFAKGIDLEFTTSDDAVREDVVVRDAQALQNAAENGDLAIPLRLTSNHQFHLAIDGKELAIGESVTSTSAAEITNEQGIHITILPPHAYWGVDADVFATSTSPISITYSRSASALTLVKHLAVPNINDVQFPIRFDAVFAFSSGSGDGYVDSAAGVPFNTWSQARDGSAGNLYAYNGNSTSYLRGSFVSGENNYWITRHFMPIDTSSLSDTDPIAGAILYLLPAGGSFTANNNSTYFTLIGTTTQLATTSVTANDFNQAGNLNNPDRWTDQKQMWNAIWATSTDFIGLQFNATGTRSINRVGYTMLGMRTGLDIENVIPTGQNYWRWYTSFASQNLRPHLDVWTNVMGPITPTGLLSNGQTNPHFIATSSVYFSALAQSSSSTDVMTDYQIQVSASSASWSSLSWDSGRKTLASSTGAGTRTPDISSTSTFPFTGKTYYWRIKFWNQAGGEGLWSRDGANFTMDMTANYGAKIESGDFTTYNFSLDDRWTAQDKKGNRYIFGMATTSRIENSATTTYRWYLTEMRDPNGNKVSYTYTQDGFQVYPSTITYTDTDAGTGIHQVLFTYENRTDIATSSYAGYPVVTKQRLKEVFVRTNGQLTHCYALSYGTGDNGYRSMLASIQESGWDSSAGTTTLPALSLAYSTSTGTWTQSGGSSNWNIPALFASNGHDQGLRDIDVNGDGLTDFVKGLSGSRAVWLNNGNDWVSTTTWTLPVDFSNGSVDQAVRIADVNGDGLADLVESWVAGETVVRRVLLNNGTSTWILSSVWQVPNISFIANDLDVGGRLIDINGDGLPELVSSLGGVSTVYINTGSGWVADTSWTFPVDFINTAGIDLGVRFADINGDGLVDIVKKLEDQTGYVYLHNGHGWTLQPDWTIPEPFVNVFSGVDLGTRLIDVNSDGLVDLVRGYTQDPSPAYNKVYLNTGKSWSLSSSQMPVIFTATDGTDRNVRTAEVDGDGLIEFMQPLLAPEVGHPWFKDGVKPDFLRQVKNERGSTVTVQYQSSPKYRNGSTLLNPKLPMQMDTVLSIATDPGFGGVIATTTYSYEGGEYYFASSTERQFSGFSTTTKTNNLNHTTRTAYHQGNTSASGIGEYNDHIAKAGKPYRIETLDGTTTSANIFSRTINQWARADYGDGRNFVKLVKSLVQTFDGDSSHRDTGTEMVYDDTKGDVSTRTAWGEVTGNTDGTFSDTGTDKATTTYTYAASSTNTTMSLPSRELVIDQSGNTVKDTKWTYDNLSFGSVTYGNQTKEERLKSGSTYASTTKTFNSYGLVTQSVDPRGGTTTFAYDTYNLYPATTTNALGYTQFSQYDYSSGKVATTTDANSRVFATVYDGLDRPIEEKQPDFMTPTTLVTKATYSYTDSTSTPSSIFRKSYLSSATTSDAYSYVDGFGRTIQTKKEAESANGWTISDSLYNNIGQVGTSTLPYFGASSAYTTATTASALFTTFTYDPEGRVKTIADVLGTTTNTYVDWRLTVTDSLGNKKDLNKDAYGNLASVVEHPTASTNATTTYTWNLLGKLTKITDALANVRNFTYDSLGRLTGSEDLHAAADSGFGTTSRQYDDASNLIQLYSPLGLATNYTYDALNRPTSENATTTASLLDVVYRYDTCTDGKGRLCEVNANNAATTTYTYNPVGLITTETRKLGSTTPQTGTTTYTYLRNGALDTLLYPDLALLQHVYDDAGLLETMKMKESGGATTSIIAAIGYSPLEQASVISYANGVISTSTFDATKKYRLTNKRTQKGGVAPLENTTYTYDAVGNITNQSDTASSTRRKVVDYTYDGLYRLLSASTTDVATTTSGYRETYTYDLLGNLLTKTDATYTYAGTGYTNPDGVTSIANSVYSSQVMSTSTIAFDATSTSISTGYNAGPQTKIWTHTVTGTSPIIVLIADIWQDVAGAGTITAATWNGGTLTKATSTGTGTKSVELWYLVATTTGAKTMSVTVTGATDAIKLGATSFTNVSPTAPLDVVAIANGTSGNPSASITTTTAGDVVIATLHRHSTTDAITNRTHLYNDHAVSTLAAGSYQLTTTEGAYTDTYTGAASHNWAMIIAGFKAATSTSGGTTTVVTNYAYDNSGNLLTYGPNTNTWDYQNRLTRSTLATSTLFYGYDHAGSRIELKDSTTTNYWGRLYQQTPGGNTAVKNLYLNNQLVATYEKTGSTGGSGTITLDATTTNISTGYNGGPQTKNWTHTTTGSDRLLVLTADIWQDVGGTGTVTSATYNGVALTKATSTRWGGMATEIWYLVNPSSGGNTLSVTVTGATDAIKLGATSFTNVDQSSPLDTVSSATGDSCCDNDPSISITTGTAQTMVITTLHRYSTTNANTNRTHLYKDRVTSTLAAGSYQLTTTAGAYTDTYTGGAFRDWSMLMASFKPVTTSTGSTTLRFIHGDQQNSTTLITDTSGTVVLESLDYLPFGAIRVDTKSTTITEPRKHIGEMFDESSQLSYLNARYFESSRGQFLSQDPMFTGDPNGQMLLDPQQLNAYNYASNNPVNKSDPSGKLLAQTVLMYNLANAYIRSTPNIPNRIREASFASQHPIATVQIGSSKDGYTGNISSVASNFAVNSITANTGYSGVLNREGGERNALRHVIWQAAVSSTLGENIAVQAGNSHEYNPFVNLSTKTYGSLAGADQAVDLLNNQIGRNIAANNPNSSMGELAQKSLDYYYNTGLYTAQKNGNDGYDITQTKISAKQYVASSNEVGKLNNGGKLK